MAKLPISVFIIAKNEADRIGLAINSVIGWVDEVVVVDSGSTDGTQELAQQLGARVLFNEWNGYGPQKVFAEAQCRNDWILNIDADEEVSPELAQEIQQIFATEHKNKFYRLKIYAIYPHQKKLPIFPAGTTQVRIYNKEFGGFKDSAVHDSVISKGNTHEIELQNAVLHRSHRNIAHTLEKINSYSDLQANDLFAKGKNPTAWKIIYTPFFAFIKCYFLKRYMFYGLDGFLHSWIYALGRTVRVAKAREKFQNSKSN